MILERLLRGFDYLTLNPAPRLRRLREQAEAEARSRQPRPCPPLPDSAYGPGAVPLDLSGIPAEYRTNHDPDPEENRR